MSIDTSTCPINCSINHFDIIPKQKIDETMSNESTPDSRGGGGGENETKPSKPDNSYRALETSELLHVMAVFAQLSGGGGGANEGEEDDDDDDVSPLSSWSRKRRNKYGIVDTRDSNVFNGW